MGDIGAESGHLPDCDRNLKFDPSATFLRVHREARFLRQADFADWLSSIKTTRLKRHIDFIKDQKKGQTTGLWSISLDRLQTPGRASR